MQKFFSTLNESSAQFVDFRFTDLAGRWHQTTYHASALDEGLLKNGLMFDGSSLAGWRGIENSDMLLVPDFNTVHIDPAIQHPTCVVICDVCDPETRTGYSRDPRTIAKKALQYLKAAEIGDTAYFGPELEFFIFDDVRFESKPDHSFFHLNAESLSHNSGAHCDGGNLAYRSGMKGNYLSTPPFDAAYDIRSDLLIALSKVGITPVLHHAEVAEAQSEIGFKYAELLTSADNIQKTKHIVRNIVHAYGKTATFMPKPIYGDNGSGMHVHQSIWDKNSNLFYDENGYGQLSKLALHYIGGILKHARAINAFTNPSTNSYKRLVPGFEAPVNLAYSSCNRSAAIRIPYSYESSAKRIEVRFPDPTANPYLALTALLMAGLDGIRNQIHPGEAKDYNLYESNQAEQSSVAHSLRDALNNLNSDRDFLKAGAVFDDALIDTYIQLKMEDVNALDQMPHPAEFKMYFTAWMGRVVWFEFFVLCC